MAINEIPCDIRTDMREGSFFGMCTFTFASRRSNRLTGSALVRAGLKFVMIAPGQDVISQIFSFPVEHVMLHTRMVVAGQPGTADPRMYLPQVQH